MIKKANKNIQIFNIYIFLLYCLVSQSIFGSVKEKTKVKLQLKWTHQFQFAGYYAAKEKGYYSKKGIDVELIELKNNENPVDVVLSGKADFGIGSSDLILERAKGKKIVLLASIFQHSPYILLSKKNRNIDNIHEIINKKIAIESHASELLLYLKEEGIQSKNVQNIPYSHGINNLIEDKIDMVSAYSTDEPFLLKEMGIEYNIFSPRASGIDFYGDSIFTTEEFIKKNPKIVEDFLETSLEGWTYALDNKEELVNIIRKDYIQGHSKEHLMSEANEIEKLIVPQIVDIGYINKGRWKIIAESYQKLNLIDKNFSTKGFYYKDIIEINLKSIETVTVILTIFLLLIGITIIVIIFFNKKLTKELKEKKIVENELKLNEAKYKLLAENTVECIWLLDLTTMKFKYISPSITHLRGLSVDEAINEKLEDSLTPESLEKIYKLMELKIGKFMSGDRSQETTEGINEFQQYRKDGSIIDVEVSTKYIYNEEKKSMDVVGVSRDISLRKKLEQKLKEETDQKNILIEKLMTSEQELKEFFIIIEHSPISVVITDPCGKIKYANKTVLNLTGYTMDELIGENPRILNSGYHPKEFYEKMWSEIKRGNEWRGEIKNIKKNREMYWERTIIIPIKNEKDEIYSFLALKEDITESKKQAEILQYQAERDPLTEIFNRRAGLYTLENRVGNFLKNKEDIVICFIDLDNLKYTNDYFGHETGDLLIKNLSQIVKNHLRNEDVFFRFGGDEFIIIFKSCSIETAEKIWERIRESFGKVNNSHKDKYILSASHGIIKYDPNKHLTVDEFIGAADKKMYEEKKTKKTKR